ncbi:MAG: NAD(+) synthase [Paludibacteraceae bacterium]|nr:NAD(+) synthase [Paludibacteraceae bacterium]
MKRIKDEMVAWIKDYFEKNGNKETKAVIGISGGKDSSVVAAACVAALGKDRVVGVLMPNGVQNDIADSKRLVEFLGIKSYEINIQDAYKGLTDEIMKKTGGEPTPQFKTNTPSRLRMTTLYGVAATLGNCRISNNGNLSECLMGYFSLWGDGAGDFAPLVNLYVNDVVNVGLELGLPESFVRKAPSDGMSGKTDEENLGFSYDDVEKVARGQYKEVNPEVVQRIVKKINEMSWKIKLLNLPRFVPSQKVLAIVDAQNDFIDGSMGVGAEKWDKAKSAIFDLLRKENYDQIVFTKDWHPANHCSFKPQGGLWPSHCVQGEKGAEIDADFEPLKLRALTLNKGLDRDVEEYGINVLRDLTNVKELHLVGLCYDYCVASCAKETAKANPDTKIVIKKAGTVAIDENAKLDFGGLPIVVE